MSESEDLPAYAEIKGLTTLIGDSPRARVLAVLVGKHYEELKSHHVAKLSGLERGEVMDHLHALEDIGVAVATRPNGGATTWRIDKDSDAARALGQADAAMLGVEPTPNDSRAERPGDSHD